MQDRQVKIITPAAGFTGLTAQKVGRNSPCRCGSRKKAKKCCGNTTAYFSRDKLKITEREALVREKEKALEEANRQ